MDGAKVGYVSFTGATWKKVSQETLRLVKKLIQPETSFKNFETLINDSWISQHTKSNSKTVSLSIDNLSKVKRLLLQLNFEKLVRRIQSQRVINIRLIAFTNVMTILIKREAFFSQSVSISIKNSGGDI
jgi:hypothetical protein